MNGALEPTALIFMVVSMVAVAALTTYCLVRVLSSPRRREPPESDPPRS